MDEKGGPSWTARILSQAEQLRAQANLRAFVGHDQPVGVEMGKAPLAAIGRKVFAHSYAATDEDFVARQRWTEHIDSLLFTDPAAHFLHDQQNHLPDGIILTIGGARWVKEGCPVYRPGHKQAAALMATRVSSDIAEHVKPPNRAFFIDLPNGLLHVSDLEGKPEPAIGVFVFVQRLTAVDTIGTELPPDDYWNWVCMTRSSLMVWQANRTLDEMIKGTALPNDEYFGYGYELDEHDQRLRQLVISLIVSLCLDLATGKELKRKVEPLERAGKKAAKGSPTCTVFLDPSTVDVDARPYVAAYLAGERNSPAFQHVVGMHWKNQAYGPGHSLRRPIRIMPYKRYEHLPTKPGEVT